MARAIRPAATRPSRSTANRQQTSSARQLDPLIKADDAINAELLLMQSAPYLSYEARAEAGQRVAWSYFAIGRDADARRVADTYRQGATRRLGEPVGLGFRACLMALERLQRRVARRSARSHSTRSSANFRLPAITGPPARNRCAAGLGGRAAC